ncbi:MAG TPA: biopolymer transporter ExbD [Gemmataceae bacterium]|jgi:biopolymer transport protein ExbD|nr:biopolymer transporter ExbD [Gemmataceae bacterium]
MHGGTEIKADPNLTPLLDVVLQLLMFFILCANFSSTQVNENIKLPLMQAARPEDKRETDLLFLNITKEGAVEVVGKDPMKKQAEIKSFLRTYYQDTKRALEKEKNKEVPTVIVIRADRNVDFKEVYQVMRWCKEIGFRKFQMRAEVKQT